MFLSISLFLRMYPGSGSYSERGKDKGEGFTLNLPFEERIREINYLHVLDKVIIPAIKTYNPNLILVSAGFDMHKDDPVKELPTTITQETYRKITLRLTDVANKCCNDRLVYVLEGGYDKKGLASSVAACVDELSS